MKHVLVLVLVALAAAPVAADNHAKAEVMFRQGRELMTKKRYAEACVAFDASQQLDPATTTVFNQADCREKNNQLATAWGLFVEAERQTRGSAGDVGGKMHQVAVDRANKLIGKLSKLTVRVAHPVDGLAITRNDEPVARFEWNRELPVDGGTYKLVAKIGDAEVWSETVIVANFNDTKTTDVVVKQIAPAVTPVPTPAPVPVVIQPTAPPTTPAPVSEATRSRRSAWVATIGGTVMLGGALTFELLGRSTYNDAKASNDIDLWHTANNERYVAETLLATGLAVSAWAVYLWLRDDGHGESRRVVPTGNGVAVVGRF
jgi:hypothetical protein